VANYCYAKHGLTRLGASYGDDAGTEYEGGKAIYGIGVAAGKKLIPAMKQLFWLRNKPKQFDP
jgi:hypothetical protein